MLKLLTGKGLFHLLRREQEQHSDIDKHLLGEPLQERPEFRFPLEAVFALKIRVDNPRVIQFSKAIPIRASARSGWAAKRRHAAAMLV